MVATLGHDLDVDPLDVLAARIRQKEAVVAVVGLGYVGPAACWSRHTSRDFP